MAKLKDINYTSIPDATVINVTGNSLYLFTPAFIPGARIQVRFNECIKKSFCLLFDSWTTHKQTNKQTKNGFSFKWMKFVILKILLLSKIIQLIMSVNKKPQIILRRLCTRTTIESVFNLH